MYMGIFIEGSDPQQAPCPEEHDGDKCESIQAEMHRVQTDIVLELSLDFIVGVDKFANELIIDSADDTQNTC